MPQKSIKSSVVSMPLIGYIARLVSNNLRLPKIREQLIKNQDEINAINSHVKTQLEQITKEIAELKLAQDNLQGQFSLLEVSSRNHINEKTSSKDLFADDHLADIFYTKFEDMFRGSEKMIAERLHEYISYFKNSKIDFNKFPVLDIGSGRGEFLQVLKQNNVRALGLDINHDMVERSNKKSLEAVEGDALEFLQKAKSQSYGSITGFHIVEHIPFNLLLRIFQAAHRSLVKDGFVIFETPNPENLIVGSTTFYMDPSHLHPLPPMLLAFALETCGFKNVEIKPLHPDTDKKKPSLDKDLNELLYGSRDYAVIAYK